MQLFYKSLFCSFLVPFSVVTFMLLKLGFHFRQGWLPTSFAVKIIKELVAVWDFQTVLPKSEHSSNRKIRELILLQENGFLEEHQTLHARKHYNSHKWRTNTAGVPGLTWMLKSGADFSSWHWSEGSEDVISLISILFGFFHLSESTSSC